MPLSSPVQNGDWLIGFILDDLQVNSSDWKVTFSMGMHTQSPIPRHVVQAPRVLVQDLAGEAVLLNLDNGLYYGLDEISFRMFSMLVSSDSVQAAYERLLVEYDVEPEQLKLDLDEFVSHLLENGLVLNADEPLD
jgi:hypothetical protein